MKKLNIFLFVTSSILFFTLLPLTNAQEVEDLKKTINIGISLTEKGRFNDAIEIFQKVIEKKPDYDEAYNCLGIAYQKKKEFNKAIEAYKKAIELKPSNKIAHRNLGNLYIDIKNYDEAIAIHEKLITLDPNDAISYMDLGVALSEKGLFEEGINQFKKSLAIDPFNPLARWNLGNVYYKMKKWPEAIDEFICSWEINEGALDAQIVSKGILVEHFSEIEKWTREKPNEPLARYYLAYALCFIGKNKKAIQEIDKAIELDKSKVQFCYAKGYFFAYQNKYNESIEVLKECIARNPSYWQAYNIISKNYLEIKKPKERVEIMLKAVNINSNIISIQTNLGNAYAGIKEFERAITTYKKAISLEAMYYGRPKDPINQFNLAACYYNSKNYEMAWRHVRMAEKMGSSDAEKLIKVLKSISKEPE